MKASRASDVGLRDAREEQDLFLFFGDVAQLGERVLCKHEVAGSTPAISTGSPIDISSVAFRADTAL